MTKKETKEEVKESVDDLKPQGLAVGRIIYFFKSEALQGGGFKLVPSAGLVIGLIGMEQNMKPEDYAINCVIWGKNGYPETKFNVRYSLTPQHGCWCFPAHVK